MATVNSVKESIQKIIDEIDYLKLMVLGLEVDEDENIDTSEVDRQVEDVFRAAEEAKSEMDDLALEIDDIQNTIQELDFTMKEVNG